MGISAGFPSPADDFKEQRLSLDNELVKNKEATFFARVSGQSMIGAGLDDDDLLVIDRSLEPTHNKIAVCFLDGEFTVKRLKVENGTIWLQPENPSYNPIKITEDNNFVIWGIVTNVIKKVRYLI
ncbi:error-prone repair protein UmuD [Jejuia pallidilutea]|uniref:Error-prone repair protein UmuD n=1 Tax=Jejuia pallidilutea TaxID=504487 RepID=A0A090VR35_9FLAO|nr:error-prone repair protein UmuD [Jejuia pallidilutea]